MTTENTHEESDQKQEMNELRSEEHDLLSLISLFKVFAILNKSNTVANIVACKQENDNIE